MSASNVNEPKPNRNYFPSLNNTTRIHSIKTVRVHILLSDKEKRLFLLLDRSGSVSVTDFIERLPLTSNFMRKREK